MRREITEREIRRLQPNYSAFVHWFGLPRIERDMFQKGAYYVFYPGNEGEQYIQWCHSIEYLNGWLYGCVQATVRGEFREGLIRNGHGEELVYYDKEGKRQQVQDHIDDDVDRSVSREVS